MAGRPGTPWPAALEDRKPLARSAPPGSGRRRRAGALRDRSIALKLDVENNRGLAIHLSPAAAMDLGGEILATIAPTAARFRG